MKGRFLLAAALLTAGLTVSCGDSSHKTVASQPVAGNWSLQAVVYRSDITYCLNTSPNAICALSVPPVPDPTNSTAPMTGKVAAPVYQAKLVPSDSCSLTDNWTRTALPQCTTSTCTQTFSVTGPKCFVAKSDPNANQGSLTCNGCESFLVTPLAEPLKPIALLVGSSTDPVTSQNSLQYVLELGVPADVNGPPIIFFTKTKDATISAGLMQGDWTCGTSDDSTAPTWANDCNPVGFYGTFEAKTAQ